MRRGPRARLVAGVALVAALTPAVSAQADVERFRDARGDAGSSVDILRVRVDNSTIDRSKVVVAVQQKNVRLGDSITIYFDTRRADRGPEYSISAFVDSEYVMNRHEFWGRVGRPVPFECGYRLRIRDDRSRAVIPRRCLGRPDEIRVAVKAVRTRPATSRDWARDRRTWLGWVAR
jgi:hypothetical protein